MKDKQIVIDKFIEEFIKTMNKDADKPKYVVALKRVNDSSLIGYHLSTLGQITDDKLSAKRYTVGTSEGMMSQLRVIQDNYSYKFTDKAVDEKALFGEFNRNLLKTKFKGIKSPDEFYLEPVELPEHVEPHTFKATKIK